MRVRVTACAMALVLASACKDKSGETATADAAVEAAAPSASAAGSGAVPSGLDTSSLHGNSDPMFNTLGMGDKLSYENKHRPKIDPNATTILAGVEKLGMKYVKRMQMAGWTIGARYCESADTSNDVRVVVCEFDDEKSAKAGAETSAKATPTLKEREVLAKKSVFVAIHDTGHSDKSAAEKKSIEDYVKKL